MKLFIRFFEIEFFYSCKAILKILSVITVQKRENFSEFYLFPIAFWSFICYIKSTIIFLLRLSIALSEEGVFFKKEKP